MKPPYWLGEPLPQDLWHHIRLRTVFDYCKWDVQSVDQCVLADFPLFIAESSWQQLGVVAETLARELAAAECELVDRKDLHRELGLPKALRRQFRELDGPAPAVARALRFDFHFTEEGWRISEVNADVPGGFIEASGFTRLMAAHYPGTRTPPDPSAMYAETLAARFGCGSVIGLVHATAYTDDHQVMRFLGKRIAERGLRPMLVSPAHLRWDQGHASICSSFAKCSVDGLVRFFPAEWLPSLGTKSQWHPFFARGRTPMSNPGSALLVQSKRFPLVWNKLSARLPAWRSVLPETRCPSEVHRELENWVVKPALGRVGEDVAIAGVTSERERLRICRAARRRPRAWVAQRRFYVVPVQQGDRNYYPSIGLFTIDGKIAGAYARVARKPLIDDEAQDIAVLIVGGGGNA